ncbi:MAG: nitroreductase family protein [Pseudomonadota bacterium]
MTVQFPGGDALPTTPEPLAARQDVLRFLSSRRSRPAKTLTTEAPSADEIRAMLKIAARTPDHGKLEPWRFIVIARDTMATLAETAERHGLVEGMAGPQAAKAAANFTFGGVIVAVVSSAKPAKIPEWEQHLSAGAVCMALLNAALAAGWGANWLTGPFSRDPGFLGPQLGLKSHEFVAGFVHMGRETSTPPDRPRPDVEALTEWR